MGTRYRLRTLMILLAVGPPLLAGGWFISQALASHRTALDLICIFAIAASIVAASAVIAVIWSKIRREESD